MSENLEGNINPTENNEIAEQPNKTTTWLVDDDPNISFALSRMLKQCSGGKMEMTHFAEAEHALVEFEKLCTEDLNRPELILMDGNLSSCIPGAKIKTGVEAIELFKQVAEKYNVPLPQIVAFSSSVDNNETLMATGATRAVNKGNVVDIRNFMTELAEAECE